VFPRYDASFVSAKLIFLLFTLFYLGMNKRYGKGWSNTSFSLYQPKGSENVESDVTVVTNAN
jgi:hypothetical protein